VQTCALPICMIDRKQNPVRLRQLAQLLSLVKASCERLHNQDMLPCADRFLCQGSVAARWGRDDDQVDVGCVQYHVRAVCNRRNAVLCPDPHGPLVSHVADGLHCALGVSSKVPDEVRAPVPASDHTDSYHSASDRSNPITTTSTYVPSSAHRCRSRPSSLKPAAR